MKNKILIYGLGTLCALLIFETGYLIGLGEQAETFRMLVNQCRPIRRIQHMQPWELQPRQMPIREQIEPIRAKKSEIFVQAMTLRETAQAKIITINLPGLDKKNISLEVKGRYLTIQARQNKETSAIKNNSYEKAFSAVSFAHIITLPDDAKAQKISAEYNNDTLTITIPKAKESKREGPSATRIPVK